MKNKIFFSNRSEVYRERSFRIAFSCCEKIQVRNLFLYSYAYRALCWGIMCITYGRISVYVPAFCNKLLSTKHKSKNTAWCRWSSELENDRPFTHPEKEFMHHELEKYEDLTGERKWIIIRMEWILFIRLKPSKYLHMKKGVVNQKWNVQKCLKQRKINGFINKRCRWCCN